MSNKRLLSDISKQNAIPTGHEDLSYEGNRFKRNVRTGRDEEQDPACLVSRSAQI